MAFFFVLNRTQSDEASFFGFPSLKRRRKTIARMLKKLERLKQDEEFFLRSTNESSLACECFFDGDGHFKLPTDFLDCAIRDLYIFLDHL